MSLSGVFLGVLGLAGLEVIVTNEKAISVLGSAGTTIAAGMNRIIDPQLGLVPSLHDSTAPLASSVPGAAGAGPNDTRATRTQMEINKYLKVLPAQQARSKTPQPATKAG
jgi:hypothetical protein